MKNLNLSVLAVSMSLIFGALSTPALAITSQDTDQQINITSQEETFSVMRTRWASYFLGDPNLPMNAKLNAEVTVINNEALELLKNLQLNKEGLWTDISLDNDSSEGRLQLGSQLYKTYQRIFTLARAYKLKGGELEGDSKLREMVIDSLAFLNEHYYQVGTAEYGNWWQWELGISRVVNNTLVILYDDIPYEIIANYIDATRYFVPRATHLSEGYGAPYSSAPLMWESTGGNRTDNAQVVLIRGLLENNESEIKEAIEALSSVIPYVKEGDGFYKDGSYIQHKDLPYSGTYGQVMIEGLGMLLGVVSNTPYQATDPNLQKIYPLLLESFAPLMVDGRMMDMVNGRAISRLYGQNDKVGQSILSAMMLYLDGAPPEYKQQLEVFIKSQLVNSNNGLERSGILSSYQIAHALMKSKDITVNKPVFHKQFAEMDRAVHHRNNWSFGIAMHSKRVGNYECINNENLKGWHTADGMTYLYNEQDHYQNGYWVTVDPYKLAGTTTLLVERDICTGQLSTQRDGRNRSMGWTGGAALEGYGVTGMDFVNFNRDLKAKKSWFMFDDEIIALGSAIENSSDNKAITTIENRKIDLESVVKVNGSVLGLDNEFVGKLDRLSIKYSDSKAPLQYVSLDEQPITISKKCRSGDWSDIGNNKGSVEACFVEATIEHKGDLGTYAYAIIPEQETIAIPAITIVSNTSDVQAVMHNKLGIFAANFFDDGKAGHIESDSSMSIITKESNGLVTISVSDPTRSWFNTKFVIDGQFEIMTDIESRITLNSNKISADLSDLAGSSYTFTLKRIK